ncbi:MAG: AMP-binding protein [Paracoccaceae bacterium]
MRTGGLAPGPACASGGDIWTEKKQEVFRIAPTGRLVCGEAGALLEALAAPGRPFRLGGAGALVAGAGEFETLTSGSTGQPRHIRRAMASWIRSFEVNAGLFGIGPGVSVAVLGGMEQSLALYGAVEALHLGAGLMALGGMRADRQRAALAGAGVIYASPAQLRLLVEAPGPVLTGTRLVLCGGAKLDEGLRAALGDLAPNAVLREFYGAAETSFVTLAGPGDPPGTVGPAYPGVEIEVRGAAGTVWVRSPYLFIGYGAGDPGPARWHEGWLSVGEIGALEPGGRLRLMGREGRMVTVADQNVFPEAIETFLLGLPGVRRAAVLPRPDARRGVHLVAFVQGDAAQEAAVMAALRRELGPLKTPRALIWRQDWPMLGSGKTDLAALAREVPG